MGGVDRPQFLALRTFCAAEFSGGDAAQGAGPGVDGGFGRGVALGIRRRKRIVHVLSVRHRG